jgi:hypothetical protein
VRHRVTARVERLVRSLRAMGEEIEPALRFVSQAARDEWRSQQSAWPSDRELREGTTALTETQLEEFSAKVRRFRDIVGGLAPKVASLPVHLPDGAATSVELVAGGAPWVPAQFGSRRAPRPARPDASQGGDDLPDSRPGLQAVG